MLKSYSVFEAMPDIGHINTTSMSRVHSDLKRFLGFPGTTRLCL
jgi:hypothetical protein